MCPDRSGGPPGAALGLFAPIFTSDAMAMATSDESWLAALLDVELALATAEADVGLIPRHSADAIAECCRAGELDIDAIGQKARLGGNPVIPLVAALSGLLPESDAGWVHYGATSQDVMDTATMIVSRNGAEVVLAELDALADAAAVLAEAHRETLEAGRTLLRQALPITFGLKAAGWLVAALEAREALRAWVDGRVALQLGGAAGTLASLGTSGPAVAKAMASRLGLRVPPMPWHTNRVRVAELACALGVSAGVAGKVALDVALLMQDEVGEVREAGSGGPDACGVRGTGAGTGDDTYGSSSTLPHKHNPVHSAIAIACARRAHGLVPVILGSMLAEHERALGAWHAEWETLGELLRTCGGAVAASRSAISGLEVDAERMERNLAASRGVLMAERATLELIPRLGRARGRSVVEAAVRRAIANGSELISELVLDPSWSGRTDSDTSGRSETGSAGGVGGLGEAGGLGDPAGYLGSAALFIEQALAMWRSAKSTGGAVGGGSTFLGERSEGELP